MGETRLFVKLLGEVTVTRGGQPLALPASKKTRALLAFLVATRASQPRQRLCDLLWDGPDDPRAALRWSLTKLRPLVDEPASVRLVGDRERVGFEALGARVDLFEAEAHVGRDVTTASTEALQSAAEALAGDFLEGLDLPDCYRFHEWCTGERERVRKLRLAVLDSLVERLGAAPEEALKYARQRVAVDPLSDVAQAAVVRLLARLGRKTEAQAQVETCRRILDRELNGRRSPALDLARLEIGKAPVSPPAVAPAPPRAPAPVLTPTGLVGRIAERAALEQLARDAAAASAHEVLLLAGEPGIGKSRLLEHLAASARREGGTVLSARAFEAESVRAYGVWIDILRGLALADLPADLRADLALLLPELGTSANDPEAKARLFDGVTRLLQILSARAPLVMIVDDLHWLDEASASLLHYVVRITVGARIAIACATRDGELSDNPAALRLVRALRRDARLVQLDLAPLDETATTDLVRSTFADLDGARVFRESGGNPLFAIEVARSFAAGLRSGEPSAEGPRALEALLEERLERLDGRARDMVVWAAALGRDFDPQLLVKVTGDHFAQTIAAIGDLEQHGLIASRGGTGYTFTHELVRKAAYRTLSGPRRRLVHQAIARVLAAAPEPGAAWGDVVHHATLADDPELTARACVAAGERCLRVHARMQARDFASRGLSQVARLGAGPGLALRLALLRVAAYSTAGSPSRNAQFEAEAHDAVHVARDLGRVEDEATGLTVLSFFRHSNQDDEGARANTVDAAEAARRVDPVASVGTIAHSAFCLVLIERELPRARALLDEAHDIARAHALSVPDLELGMGTLLHFESDTAPARARLERAMELARARGDSWRESVAVTRLAMLAVECNDWDAARRRASDLREVARKFGDGTEGVAADALDAVARHGSGEADGRIRVEATASALVNADAKSMLAFVLTIAAETELRALASDAAEQARAWATTALGAAEPVGRPSAIVLARVAMGRAALAAGAPEMARTHLAAARALVGDPYAMSTRARRGIEHLADASNAGTNGDVVGKALRTRRRR